MHGAINHCYELPSGALDKLLLSLQTKIEKETGAEASLKTRPKKKKQIAIQKHQRQKLA